MADGNMSALPEPGTVLGRYTILRCLGIGGMGAVFAAHERELDREVAIKLLRDPTLLSMQTSGLRREATAMAKISDPAVVHVYEVGSIDGQAFVAMELIDGMSLRAWCQREPRSWQDITKVMLAAGRGLVAAHDAGVVHRDVKPDNVLIGHNGRVCVVDFGLAKRVAEPGAAGGGTAPVHAAGDGSSSLYAGTPAYMAPEQHLGKPATPASDQFGYCVMFWEALFGRLPFGGSRAPDLSTAPLLALAIIGNRIEEPDRPDIPRWLIDMLRRGLSLDPALRWPSIAALLAAIQRELDRPRGRGARRLARAGVIFAGVVVVGVAAFAVRAWSRDPSRSSRKAAAIEIAYDRARRVTFARGCEGHPVFVPGRPDEILYARRSGPSASLQRIGPGSVAEDVGTGASPAISPAGRYIAALDRADVIVLDTAPGATPRRAGTSTCGPAWLNERELVVCDRADAGGASDGGPRAAVIARPVDGGGDRVLGYLPPSTRGRAVTVGGNGRIFAIYRAEAGIAESIVVEVVPGAPLREVRRGVLAAAGVRYRASDNRVYFGQRMNSNQLHLFAQPADGVVEPTPVVGDTPPNGGFDITPDGRRLVLSTCAEVSSLVKIQRDGRVADLTPRSSWLDNRPRIIDKDRFVYTSTRGGELQVWLHDAAVAHDRALTRPESAYPTVSPDRATLVYVALGDGKQGGLVARALGSDETRRLTEGHVERSPAFLPDGSAVLFLRQTDAGLRLHRVALAGGPTDEVIPAEVRAFDLSPVGDALVAVMPIAGRDHLRIGTTRGNDLRDVPGADALGTRLKSVRFSRDGTTVLVVNGDSAILELELATGRAQTRWQTEGSDLAGVGEVDYDVDGETIVAGMVRLDGDLWVLEGRF